MYHSYYEERIKKIMVQREYMQVRAGTGKQKKEEKKKKRADWECGGARE